KIGAGELLQTFYNKVLTEIFPGREYVPKTLIFAKDDSHAEDIVKIIREMFGKGNDFAQKITYKTTGKKPEELIAEFRNSFNPRIAVTVDMIATGTDIKPLEIVMFMRAVKSRSFFEQMKGRGVRIINSNDLQSVTPDARVKDHFIIVDCVGVCEMDKTDSRPMERKPTVSLDKLLQAVSLGNTDPDVISSLAARMARIGRQITPEDDQQVIKFSGGKTLEQLTTDLVTSIKPDNHVERARQDGGGAEPSEEQIKQAAVTLIMEATRPLHNPELRNFLVEVKRKHEQVIDNISEDQLISAEFSAEALEKVKSMTQSFEQFLADNRDEITALQVLYSKPYKSRLRFEDIKELAARIEKPPHHFRVESLWDAYAALETARVKGANAPHILTDLVSLVRFAMHQENELVPFPEKVGVNFKAWLTWQESAGKKFSNEQRQWLVMIRDHIAANLGIETDDFDYAPFSQQGGLGKVYQLFGDELNTIIEELNGALAA
ncbi:MAG TPA: type III restriction endonuclease subunit R, partial [Desulfarculaceae bacterium]|nr:type III restriction endonuclease subunit R [Desulfarculaceae bacterium]